MAKTCGVSSDDKISTMTSLSFHSIIPSISPVADDLDGFRTIFTSETSQGFAERHLWLSLADRPPRSRFTRVQRVTCVLTLTLTFLAVDILWYALLAAPSTLAWAMGEVRCGKHIRFSVIL